MPPCTTTISRMKQRYSDEDLLDFLTDFESKEGKVTQEKFKQVDEHPAPSTISDRFGGWSEALRLAGVRVNRGMDEGDVLQEIRLCHDKYGDVRKKHFDNDNDLISSHTVHRFFDSVSHAASEAGIEQTVNQCSECGGVYSELGKHFSKSSCSESLSDEQYEIIKGIVLGDGWVNWQQETPSVEVSLTNRDALEWIDEKLSTYSNGVKSGVSAASRAENNRRSGFHPDASEEAYDDTWNLTTLSMESLQPIANWYSAGEKRIPETVDITSESLRMWYICDGTIRWSGQNSYIVITTSKYSFGSDDVIDSVLDNYPGSHKVLSDAIRFMEPKNFFEYIGEPIPGFEYKWEYEDREKYSELLDSTK